MIILALNQWFWLYILPLNAGVSSSKWIQMLQNVHLKKNFLVHRLGRATANKYNFLNALFSSDAFYIPLKPTIYLLWYFTLLLSLVIPRKSTYSLYSSSPSLLSYALLLYPSFSHSSSDRINDILIPASFSDRDLYLPKPSLTVCLLCFHWIRFLYLS